MVESVLLYFRLSHVTTILMGIVCLAFLSETQRMNASEEPVLNKSSAGTHRYDNLPRKVLVGTVVTGYDVNSMPLDQRFRKMDQIVEAISVQAKSKYPSRRLDLVVLPEYFLGRPGQELPQETVRLEEVSGRVGACARRYGCYLVVPMLLREEGTQERSSNAALLVDRKGRVVGIYRKVHPVAGHGSEILEGGTVPGRELPVFECDFGRLGIQICYDMFYPDGWRAMAEQGADIVALPTASPETVHPSFYALQYQYYVVSAAPRDHSAVYSPLGMIDAQVSKEGEVLVDEIDLSYETLHWDADLQEGEALRRKFGDRIGFRYYHSEDMGIFWSNDPTESVGQMVRSLGLSPAEAEVQRLGVVQDNARGGPPARGDFPAAAGH
jgi:predicted amidohydrolase